ncbi:MAG: hypothetical protein EBX99_13895, partial [Acidimicrobiia bacterium]|nr:hypothetical protein [Acidimicrobiia bacterium]
GIDQINVEALGTTGLTGDATLGEFDIFALESALNTANINGGPALGLQISDAQANTLADGTVAFADDASQVLVDAGEGTHLATSLKELQKLNIDAVSVMGDGSLTVELGGAGGDLESIATGGLPQFDLNDNISLELSSTSELINGGLDAAGVNALLTAGIDQLTLNITDINSLFTGIDGGLDSALTSAVNLAETAGTGIAPLDVRLDVGGHQNADSLTISDSQAQALVTNGLEFVAQDNITVDAGEGTHLATSLKELQKLNIDAVSVMGDGLTVDLGEGSINSISLDANGLPSFTDTADITLALNSAEQVDLGNLESLTAGLASLEIAGIDQINVEALGTTGLTGDATLGEFDIFALESAL